MNMDELTEAVWERLQGEKPRALLLGDPPFNYHNYIYVNQKPYEAVILGLLGPGELLHMPNDAVCRALLEGTPVYLWHKQCHHTGTGARLLRQELYGAEARLKRLGVQILGKEQRLITAEEARSLRQAGKQPPAGSRLTPLARDILGGIT